MFADCYIVRVYKDMKLTVRKNHLGSEIISRSGPDKKRRHIQFCKKNFQAHYEFSFGCTFLTGSTVVMINLIMYVHLRWSNYHLDFLFDAKEFLNCSLFYGFINKNRKKYNINLPPHFVVRSEEKKIFLKFFASNFEFLPFLDSLNVKLWVQ